MIARTLSKLYPAPIALCQHDLIGTIEQITNDLTRLMIADISETRAAQATNQNSLKPPPAARDLHPRFEFDVANQNLGLKSHLSRSYSDGSLH